MTTPSTILVVEDEPAIRTLYVRMLTEAGFQVQAVANGLEGLQEALAVPFDLILTNSRMPLLNGNEMVAAIRRQQPAQKILHVSGSHGMTSQPGHLPADVPTLFKPFGPDELVDAVHRLLGGQPLP